MAQNMTQANNSLAARASYTLAGLLSNLKPNGTNATASNITFQAHSVAAAEPQVLNSTQVGSGNRTTAANNFLGNRNITSRSGGFQKTEQAGQIKRSVDSSARFDSHDLMKRPLNPRHHEFIADGSTYCATHFNSTKAASTKGVINTLLFNHTLTHVPSPDEYRDYSSYQKKITTSFITDKATLRGFCTIGNDNKSVSISLKVNHKYCPKQLELNGPNMLLSSYAIVHYDNSTCEQYRPIKTSEQGAIVNPEQQEMPLCFKNKKGKEKPFMHQFQFKIKDLNDANKIEFKYDLKMMFGGAILPSTYEVKREEVVACLL